VTQTTSGVRHTDRTFCFGVARAAIAERVRINVAGSGIPLFAVTLTSLIRDFDGSFQHHVAVVILGELPLKVLAVRVKYAFSDQNGMG
jgi:hypothetical protein